VGRKSLRFQYLSFPCSSRAEQRPKLPACPNRSFGKKGERREKKRKKAAASFCSSARYEEEDYGSLNNVSLRKKERKAKL
jgi:hypothetical protein